MILEIDLSDTSDGLRIFENLSLYRSRHMFMFIYDVTIVHCFTLFFFFFFFFSFLFSNASYWDDQTATQSRNFIRTKGRFGVYKTR